MYSLKINFGQSLSTSILCMLAEKILNCVYGYIWIALQDLRTYRTWAKFGFKDFMCLGGENVGRGMESPFHVLYLTFFHEVRVLPCASSASHVFALPNIGSWYV